MQPVRTNLLAHCEYDVPKMPPPSSVSSGEEMVGMGAIAYPHLPINLETTCVHIKEKAEDTEAAIE